MGKICVQNVIIKRKQIKKIKNEHVNEVIKSVVKDR